MHANRYRDFAEEAPPADMDGGRMKHFLPGDGNLPLDIYDCNDRLLLDSDDNGPSFNGCTSPCNQGPLGQPDLPSDSKEMDVICLRMLQCHREGIATPINVPVIRIMADPWDLPGVAPVLQQQQAQAAQHPQSSKRTLWRGRWLFFYRPSAGPGDVDDSEGGSGEAGGSNNSRTVTGKRKRRTPRGRWKQQGPGKRVVCAGLGHKTSLSYIERGHSKPAVSVDAGGLSKWSMLEYDLEGYADCLLVLITRTTTSFSTTVGMGVPSGMGLPIHDQGPLCLPGPTGGPGSAVALMSRAMTEDAAHRRFLAGGIPRDLSLGGIPGSSLEAELEARLGIGMGMAMASAGGQCTPSLWAPPPGGANDSGSGRDDSGDDGDNEGGSNNGSSSNYNESHNTNSMIGGGNGADGAGMGGGGGGAQYGNYDGRNGSGFCTTIDCSESGGSGSSKRCKGDGSSMDKGGVGSCSNNNMAALEAAGYDGGFMVGKHGGGDTLKNKRRQTNAGSSSSSGSNLRMPGAMDSGVEAMNPASGVGGQQQVPTSQQQQQGFGSTGVGPSAQDMGPQSQQGMMAMAQKPTWMGGGGMPLGTPPLYMNGALGMARSALLGRYGMGGGSGAGLSDLAGSEMGSSSLRGIGDNGGDSHTQVSGGSMSGTAGANAAGSSGCYSSQQTVSFLVGDSGQMSTSGGNDAATNTGTTMASAGMPMSLKGGTIRHLASLGSFTGIGIGGGMLGPGSPQSGAGGGSEDGGNWARSTMQHVAGGPGRHGASMLSNGGRVGFPDAQEGRVDGLGMSPMGMKMATKHAIGGWVLGNNGSLNSNNGGNTSNNNNHSHGVSQVGDMSSRMDNGEGNFSSAGSCGGLLSMGAMGSSNGMTDGANSGGNGSSSALEAYTQGMLMEMMREGYMGGSSKATSFGDLHRLPLQQLLHKHKGWKLEEEALAWRQQAHASAGVDGQNGMNCLQQQRQGEGGGQGLQGGLDGSSRADVVKEEDASHGVPRDNAANNNNNSSSKGGNKASASLTDNGRIIQMQLTKRAGSNGQLQGLDNRMGLSSSNNNGGGEDGSMFAGGGLAAGGGSNSQGGAASGSMSSAWSMDMRGSEHSGTTLGGSRGLERSALLGSASGSGPGMILRSADASCLSDSCVSNLFFSGPLSDSGVMLSGADVSPSMCLSSPFHRSSGGPFSDLETSGMRSQAGGNSFFWGSLGGNGNVCLSTPGMGEMYKGEDSPFFNLDAGFPSLQSSMGKPFDEKSQAGGFYGSRGMVDGCPAGSDGGLNYPQTVTSTTMAQQNGRWDGY
eukprot:jgi/Mesvir1/24186/Mv10903-RA.1